MGLHFALVLGLASFSLIPQSVFGECTLKFRQPYPRVMRSAGDKYLMAEEADYVKRATKETVLLYCANTFKVIKGGRAWLHYKTTLLNATCKSNTFWDTYWHGNVAGINCLDNLVPEMHISDTKLPDCDKYMTFVVGQKFDHGQLKSVAMCYDIVNQQLKYAAYTAYPSKFRKVEKAQVGQLNRLGMDFKVDFSMNLFGSENAKFERDIFSMPELGCDSHEYALLVQDESFTEELGPFKNMISIVWMRALRIGNWHRLLNALQLASLHAKFDVNIGVSGLVKLPMDGTCRNLRNAKVKFYSSDTVVKPALIWAHIQAVESSSNGVDDFVVIGQNSLVYTGTHLCQSMCNEVMWLRDSPFGQWHQLPTYGLVQCCRTADVAHKLDNFPKIN